MTTKTFQKILFDRRDMLSWVRERINKRDRAYTLSLFWFHRPSLLTFFRILIMISVVRHAAAAINTTIHFAIPVSSPVLAPSFLLSSLYTGNQKFLYR